MQLANDIRVSLHKRAPYNSCPLCGGTESSVDHRADANLYGLLRDTGFEPIHYTVSQRYRVGMEVIARKVTS